MRSGTMSFAQDNTVASTSCDADIKTCSVDLLGIQESSSEPAVVATPMKSEAAWGLFMPTCSSSRAFRAQGLAKVRCLRCLRLNFLCQSCLGHLSPDSDVDDTCANSKNLKPYSRLPRRKVM